MNERVYELEEKILNLNSKIHEYKKEINMFENILDKIDEAIYVYDSFGKLIYINRRSEKIEEKNKNFLLGKKDTEIWDTNLVLPLIKNKKLIEKQRMDYITPNGKRVHIIHSMYPQIIGNEVVGCFSITKDVTKINDMIMNIYELREKLLTGGKPNIPINGTRYSLEDIIGDSEQIKLCVKTAYKVSTHKSNILLYGETGTGKELFAQGIHNAGINCNEPFIAINCSAVPENLVESLLFGTVKGAFTNALETRGLFEQVGGGTLFLDEINSMPISIQPKLLRVLQEKKYRRLGGSKDKNVMCRIISSTNVEPSKAIELGQLRQDLYYRISSIILEIPPLRERTADINLLMCSFIDKYNKILNTHIDSVDSKLIEACMNYQWYGNVRELEHMIENAMNLSDDYEKKLYLDLFPVLLNNKIRYNQKKIGRFHYEGSNNKIDLKEELNNYELKLIKNSLMNNKGNIAASARQLSIHRSVLYNKFKKLDINLDCITEYVLK